MSKKRDPASRPESVGPYRVLRTLGSGSMATVFLAEKGGKAGFRKKLALKIIRPELSDDPTFIKLLMREAAIGGLLRHPNIIQTLSFEQYDGQYVLVLEYVAGQTLNELLKPLRGTGKGIDPSLALDIAVQACRALDYAHRLEDDDGTPLKIIHRDMKPANLVLSEHRVLKVMDFGIARAAASWADLTAKGIVRGTPAYMSPEQVLGHKLDGRSDLFPLGSILCEMILGDLVFSGKKLLEVMERVARVEIGDTIERVDAVVPGCKKILDQLLTVKAEDRYPDAAALGAALKKLLLGGGRITRQEANALNAVEDLSNVTEIAIRASDIRRRSHQATEAPEPTDTGELEEATAISPSERRPLKRSNPATEQIGQGAKQAGGEESERLSDSRVEEFIYREDVEDEEFFVFEELSSEEDGGAEAGPEAPLSEDPTPPDSADPSWTGTLANEFFGDEHGPPNRGNMGPSDPEESTQAVVQAPADRPTEALLAASSPEEAKATPDTPTPMTDDLDRDILDGVQGGPSPEAQEDEELLHEEDDELWSDAPAEGSAQLQEAMEAMEVDDPAEDDLWGDTTGIVPVPTAAKDEDEELDEAAVEDQEELQSESVSADEPQEHGDHEATEAPDESIGGLLEDEATDFSLVELDRRLSELSRVQTAEISGSGAPAKVTLEATEDSLEAAEERTTPNETVQVRASTADELVAATRSTVESTERLLSKTLSEFPAQAGRRAHDRKARMEAKVNAARTRLAEVEVAAAAVAESEDPQHAEQKLVEARKASENAEIACTRAVADGREAMQMARDAIAKALAESAALREAVTDAETLYGDFEQLIKEGWDRHAAATDAGVADAQSADDRKLSKMEASLKAADQARKVANRSMRRVRAAAKSVTAMKHRDIVAETIKPKDKVVRRVIEQADALLARAKEEAEERERQEQERKRQAESLERARRLAENAAQEAKEAAEQAAQSLNDLKESIRAFAAVGKTATTEFEQVEDASERASAEADTARSRSEAVAASEDLEFAEEELAAAKAARNQARKAAEEAKVGALRGRRAAASEASERAAMEAEARRKQAEERAQAARLRRLEEERQAAAAAEKARLEVEAAAQRETEEAARKKAEEEARKKAEEAARKKAEEAARKKAEEEARLAAEEASMEAMKAADEEREAAEKWRVVEEAVLRTLAARDRAATQVTALESSRAIPQGSDLERLLADAQSRAAQVAFAAEEIEELVSAARQQSGSLSKEIQTKAEDIAARAEHSADETEASVQFAAQLGGFDLLFDDPPEPDDSPAEEGPPQPAAPAEGDAEPDWLDELIEEAKVTGRPGDKSLDDPRPETNPGPDPESGH
ncbi:MAG: protein kinase [Myxococcota bacterium]|nr:protein kinase [Myxococcota bacterium]